MKKIMVAMSVLGFFAITQESTATGIKSYQNIKNTLIEHGGGCRKNSPPGKCCHAGSKPYHCH